MESVGNYLSKPDFSETMLIVLLSLPGLIIGGCLVIFCVDILVRLREE